MAFLDPVLNPILLPLINKSPFLAILIISLVISVLITFVYKLVTNQEKMKEMKDKQKDYQKKMKELRSNPEEMMKVQKEAMKINMEYMKQSFKPTLITMLPIILIFGWMAAHFSYEPIYPGETYSVTAFFNEGIEGTSQLVIDDGTQFFSEESQDIVDKQVTWNLKSDEGPHLLTFKQGKTEQTRKILISKNFNFEDPIETFEHSDITKAQINYNKLKPLGDYSIFGWRPGWLGIYIIFSIVFSMVLRKVLKIY
jgi:uncharacterized membrane protein (DUF106 family)